MQHINRLLKSDGVNHTKRITQMIFHNFQNTGAFTLPVLCRRWHATLLDYSKRKTHITDDILGKTQQILFWMSQSNVAAYLGSE